MKTEKKDLQLAVANPLSVDCDSGSSSDIGFFSSGANNRTLNPFFDNNLRFENISESISNDSISDADFQAELLRDFESLSTDRNDFQLHKELNETFTVCKKYSEVVASVYEKLKSKGKMISASKIKRIWDCGNFLGFALTSDGYKLREANFCRDRLCPQCQRRKSLKMFSQLSSILDLLSSDRDSFGVLKFGMVTLTIQNCDFGNLSQGIDKLIDGFRKLTHGNRKISRLFRKGIIAGVFRSIEITYNEDTNTWHPHMHCMFSFTPTYFTRGNYLKTHEWSAMWNEATGSGEDYILDIRMIKNYQKGKNEEVSLQDLQDGIREVAKYCVKGSDFVSPDDLDLTEKKISVLIDALEGRKLYNFTGCFRIAQRILKLDDIESGDLIHTDSTEINEEIATMIRRFRWSGYGYQEI